VGFFNDAGGEAKAGTTGGGASGGALWRLLPGRTGPRAQKLCVLHRPGIFVAHASAADQKIIYFTP